MSKDKTLQWNPKDSVLFNASRELPALVAAYFAQVREALSGEPKAADLHPVRLLTKRLRYTLELFRPCYGPGLRERLAALRRIQQCLGEVNDCVTVKAVVARFSKKGSPVRHRCERFLQKRSAAKIQEFRREWRESFDAPGRERWWTTYLARHARLAQRKS